MYFISNLLKNITQVFNCLMVIVGASIKACRVTGRHIVALEKDSDIFQAILVPMKKTNPLVVIAPVTKLLEAIQVSQDLDTMTVIPQVFVCRDRPSK